MSVSASGDAHVDTPLYSCKFSGEKNKIRCYKVFGRLEFMFVTDFIPSIVNLPRSGLSHDLRTSVVDEFVHSHLLQR